MCISLYLPASGLCEKIKIWFNKASLTFCSYLNCCYCRWRQMMSLPIRPWLSRKQPVVRHCPCHLCRKATFLLLFYVSVPLCVHAVLLYVCACVWNESPALDEGVAPSLRKIVSESLLHMASSGLTASRSLPAASAKHKDEATYSAIQEQRTALCYI